LRTIRSERLVLRPLRTTDVPELSTRLLGDLEVMRYLFAGRALGREQADAFMRREFARPADPAGLAVLCERQSGRLVGFAGLRACACVGPDELEFGFALAREAWGRGYATEIGRAQIRFGFDELGRRRLFALSHPDNRASVRVLRKLGLHFVKCVAADAERGPRHLFCIERGSSGAGICPAP